MIAPNIHLCESLHDLSLRAADGVAAVVADAVQRRGRCSLVLSGGRTPRTLYEMLASDFRTRIPWEHVHVFWGDERYVAADDPSSNYCMARGALLNHVACSPAHIHPMPTSPASPDSAARDYERTLREHFDGDSPHFDLLLLGMGEEGHTASLFPGSPALLERSRWVVATHVPAQPPLRLTLTLPALTAAAHTYVLVAGARKAETLRRVLTGEPDPITYPVAAVRTSHGSVTWWVDREAARQLAGDSNGPEVAASAG